MKSLTILIAAASALALAGAAQADTRDTNKDKATMEKNAAPSAPVKQEEERTQAHSQPDTPTPGGTSANSGKKPAKSTAAKQKPAKESPSTGASSPSTSVPSPDRDAAFKIADVDGDGSVSKAEAAGNEQLVKGFDRADKNRDGKLGRAEYENVFRAKGKPTPQAAR